ncbi:hypothetical protein K458DRAFT_315718 [Lentithecium fluviatile CBS 122367]|uniref:Uncharacterized protein n=1 Tax=Lentithecium fluviatile CBS 122367 TaxID=1168545 RepID=A0A6G1ILX0_9PLEO|nr:hypothetical protein K458DRAFT_315718 [Lentithecium fluviatile CBS 122367]
MIPFPRDDLFVGREDIIAEISEKRTASPNHTRVALVGLIRRHWVSIRYAYRIRESSSQTWVFWVHAGNAARFEQAYRDIATKLDLPGRAEPKADIPQLVYNWLCDEANGQWLMTVDNADEDHVFFSHNTESGPHIGESPYRATPLARFLPRSINGAVLFTSRNLVATINLVRKKDNVIRVKPMAEDDALAI